MLSFTVFHQDLNASVLAQFCILLFMKRLHWLASIRVGQAARVQNVPFMHHIRLASYLLLLFLVDNLTAVSIGYYVVSSTDTSILLLFALEVNLGLCCLFFSI